jgi:hypothetical protein
LWTDFYLAQEYTKLGRVVDKIIDRYFHRIKQEDRDNRAREEFLSRLKIFYPDQINGLQDFTTNDIAKFKLDRLIQKSPGAYFWQESHVFEEEQEVNPEYDENLAKKASHYMEELITERIGGEDISLEIRFELIEEFIPMVNEKYPPQEEVIFSRKRRPFEEFCQLFQASSEQRAYEVSAQRRDGFGNSLK